MMGSHVRARVGCEISQDQAGEGTGLRDQESTGPRECEREERASTQVTLGTKWMDAAEHVEERIQVSADHAKLFGRR